MHIPSAWQTDRLTDRRPEVISRNSSYLKHSMRPKCYARNTVNEELKKLPKCTKQDRLFIKGVPPALLAYLLRRPWPQEHQWPRDPALTWIYQLPNAKSVGQNIRDSACRHAVFDVILYFCLTNRSSKRCAVTHDFRLAEIAKSCRKHRTSSTRKFVFLTSLSTYKIHTKKIMAKTRMIR